MDCPPKDNSLISEHSYDSNSAEELREALIDLDRVCERERNLRLQTEGLLEGLRVFTRAQNTTQMFDEFTAVLQRFVSFESAFLIQAFDSSDTFEVTQSTSSNFEGSHWVAADMLRRVATGKIVAVFDISSVSEWQAQPPSVRERVRSAIHLPLRTGSRCAVLVFTHSSTAYFDRHHVSLLERFAPLTTQAMASMEYLISLKEYAHRIEYMAKHDALTGLPNRSVLANLVDVFAALARRTGKLLVLLFLDLDDFKHVNDTFGHSFGDELLKVIAQRLREIVRESDTVVRLGGDEFVILLAEIDEIGEVHRVAGRILYAVEQPVVVEDQTLFVSVSIGAAICPADGEDVESLLKNADAAMYIAKDEGRNRIRFYSPEMSENARVHLKMEGALRQTPMSKK